MKQTERVQRETRTSPPSSGTYMTLENTVQLLCLFLVFFLALFKIYVLISKAIASGKRRQKTLPDLEKLSEKSLLQNDFSTQVLEKMPASAENTVVRDLLPDNLKPQNYKVLLQLETRTLSFTGNVTIDVTIAKATNEIVLHYKEGKIIFGVVEFDSKLHMFSEKDVTYKGNKCYIKVNNTLDPFKAKTAKIHISFAGLLNSSPEGFYKSNYVHEGVQKWIFATQMESTACRRVFPCFDEPRSKAYFKLTLELDRNYMALSNTEEVKVEEFKTQDGREMKRVEFATTQKMSTYLLAWVIGEFDYLEGKSPQKDAPVTTRVFATKGKLPMLKYPLEHAIRTLDFFSAEFGFPYVMNKIDHVAIPDFEAGAMENWGLITYREARFLYDEKNSGAAWKEQISEVISHELAHQWFGNLVTMEFWDSLWLNEGFATWMSWYANNHFFPDWKLWEDFISNSLQSALRLDGLKNSHPIEAKVANDFDIDQIFDAISYHKGSCLIRMLSKYLGEEIFMSGIRAYIKKHKYSNTATEDLWRCLSEASERDVEGIMDNWIKKEGYPYLNVTKRDGKFHVSQTRFLYSGEGENDDTLYCCPLNVKVMYEDSKVENLPQSLLETKETDVQLSKPAKAVKFNSDQTAFYRTRYEQGLLQEIIRYPTDYPGFLTTSDRACLVSDTYALSSAGLVDPKDLLSMLMEWKYDDQRIVWEQIGSAAFGLTFGPFLFENAQFRGGLKDYLRKLVSEKALELGWEFKDGEDHNRTQFKTLMFRYAAQADVPKVVDACRTMFKNFTAKKTDAIDPNIRSTVFRTAMRNGGNEEWNSLYQIYETSQNIDERITALRSLGEAPANVRHKTLELMLSDSVKIQDVIYPVIWMANSAEAVNEMWQFFEENYDRIYAKAPTAGTMIQSIIKVFTSSFTSLEQKKKVEDFFSSKDTSRFTLALAQSVESIESNAKVVARDRAAIKEYLSKHGHMSSTVQL